MQPVVIAGVISVSLSFFTLFFMIIYLCKLNEWLCFSVQRDRTGNIIKTRHDDERDEIEMVIAEQMGRGRQKLKFPKGGFASEMPIRHQYASEMPIRRVQVFASEMPIRRTIPNEMPLERVNTSGFANEMPTRQSTILIPRDSNSNQRKSRVSGAVGTPKLRMRQAPSGHSGRRKPDFGPQGVRTPGSKRGTLAGRPSGADGATSRENSRTPSHSQERDHHEIDLSRAGSHAPHLSVAGHSHRSNALSIVGLRAQLDQRKQMGYDPKAYHKHIREHQHHRGSHAADHHQPHRGSHAGDHHLHHHSPHAGDHHLQLHRVSIVGDHHHPHPHRRGSIAGDHHHHHHHHEHGRETQHSNSLDPTQEDDGDHHGLGIFRSDSNVEAARSPKADKKHKHASDGLGGGGGDGTGGGSGGNVDRIVVKDKDGVEQEWVAAVLQGKTYWINPETLESRWTLPGQEEETGGIFD